MSSIKPDQDHLMKHPVSLSDIGIRNQLKPGDIGYITWLHGSLYEKEHGYGVGFESIVANGLYEFAWNHSDRSKAWICEHQGQIIGCLFLVDRGNAAQLRFFFIVPEFRGIGLGKKLMDLYMDFLKESSYRSSYLWTTHELLPAIRMYQSYGFMLTEEKPSTDFGKKLIEQRYEWRF